MPTPEESERMISRLRATLEAQVGTNGKCYFPCNQCMGLKRRRLVRKIVERHCWMYGHCEGGNTFHPMKEEHLLYECSRTNILFVIMLLVN
jgi:hypothetical protein